MRAKAPARLRALKALNAVGTSGQEHDGVAMYQGLRALKHAEGPMSKRSSEWHEAEFWRMAGDPLPDHCGVADYVSKINTFMEVHLPNGQDMRSRGKLRGR